MAKKIRKTKKRSLEMGNENIQAAAYIGAHMVVDKIDYLRWLSCENFGGRNEKQIKMYF